MTYFCRQRTFSGEWTPVLSDSNPEEHSTVKAGTRTVRDVVRLPEAARTLTLGQINEIAPGGKFFVMWQEDFKALNPGMPHPDEATALRARSCGEKVPA